MSALIHRLLIPSRALAAAALCLVLLAMACEKKMVRTTPPVLVPSIESSPQPEPQPEPAASATPAPPLANPPEPEPDVQKSRHKPHKTIVRAKPAPPPAEAAKPEPQKPEIAKPAAEPAKPAAPDSSVQITAAVPRSAVQSQTQNTEQLLRSSETKLASLNRSLNEGEQAMATQARNYIAQSHQAIQEGEVERAYNLAVKASLLAAELAK